MRVYICNSIINKNDKLKITALSKTSRTHLGEVLHDACAAQRPETVLTHSLQLQDVALQAGFQ